MAGAAGTKEALLEIGYYGKVYGYKKLLVIPNNKDCYELVALWELGEATIEKDCEHPFPAYDPRFCRDHVACTRSFCNDLWRDIVNLTVTGKRVMVTRDVK